MLYTLSFCLEFQRAMKEINFIISIPICSIGVIFFPVFNICPHKPSTLCFRGSVSVQAFVLVVSNYNRLDNLNANNSSLVRHAIVEQGVNELSWCQNTKTLLELAGHNVNSGNLANPTAVLSKFQDHFNSNWDTVKSNSKKLGYYSMIKKDTSIGFKPFLNLSGSNEWRCLMRLRTSSHRLN